ncbi:MAG: hypothetical protein J6D54_08360 [Olsenella sp.]|nr:hypothetical protein [Olsenella sp.]
MSDREDAVRTCPMANGGHEVCHGTCAWCPAEFVTDPETGATVLDVLQDIRDSLRGIHEELRGIGR